MEQNSGASFLRGMMHQCSACHGSWSYKWSKLNLYSCILKDVIHLDCVTHLRSWTIRRLEGSGPSASSLDELTDEMSTTSCSEADEVSSSSSRGIRRYLGLGRVLAVPPPPLFTLDFPRPLPPFPALLLGGVDVAVPLGPAVAPLPLELSLTRPLRLKGPTADS